METFQGIAATFTLYYTRKHCSLRYFELDIDKESSASWSYWVNRRVSRRIINRLSVTAMNMERSLDVRL